MSEQQLEDKIILDGKEIIIKKLRAGKFYEAQTIITELLKEASKMSSISSKLKTNKTAKDIDPTDANIDKLSGDDFSNMIEVYQKFPSQVVKFIAICANMTEQEILDTAYPEEMPPAFSVCFILNNVKENLKNLSAPMRALA